MIELRDRRTHARYIANATVDRLLHHAHIVLTASDSTSLTQATVGKGGDATNQLTRRAEQLAATGQLWWPRLGSSTVRRWADPTGR